MLKSKGLKIGIELELLEKFGLKFVLVERKELEVELLRGVKEVRGWLVRK